MTQITAAMVKELRDSTGAGMMDVKNALTEAQGDMEQAVVILRKKGLAAAGKKAGRVTAEGTIVAHVEGRTGVLVEVNCETDFVGRNENFKNFATEVAKAVASSKAENVEAFLAENWPGSDEPASQKAAEHGGLSARARPRRGRAGERRAGQPESGRADRLDQGKYLDPPFRALRSV